MRTVAISFAKAHLSRLVGEVAKGENFTITKNGKPLVIFEAVRSEPSEPIPDHRD